MAFCRAELTVSDWHYCVGMSAKFLPDQIHCQLQHRDGYSFQSEIAIEISREKCVGGLALVEQLELFSELSK